MIWRNVIFSPQGRKYPKHEYLFSNSFKNILVSISSAFPSLQDTSYSSSTSKFVSSSANSWIDKVVSLFLQSRPLHPFRVLYYPHSHKVRSKSEENIFFVHSFFTFALAYLCRMYCEVAPFFTFVSFNPHWLKTDFF